MERRFFRLNQVLAVLFAVLVLRLAQLQLVQGRRYSYLSDRNRIRQTVLPTPRGRILDRHNRVIAETRPSFTCTVVPTELTDSTLSLLSRLLELPEPELRRRIRPVAAYASPVKMKRDLSPAEVCRIEENSFRLVGVHLRIDPVRSYPAGEPHGHVLGHLGEASDEDRHRDTTLRPLDLVGRSGVEAQYEQLLRGRDGSEYVEVDARGQEVRPLREKRPVPAVPGRELHLTIDDRIQQLAAHLTRNYERAAVVGLEVRTGKVICLLSRPTFDPSVFTGPVDTGAWSKLIRNRAKPFFNRAVSSGYPPGSTMKPVVALAALRRGVIAPATTLDPCHGAYRYGNRTFKCWSSHGAVNLIEALAVSCNTYFYQVGLRLGIDSLTAFAAECGLGRPTGIDLPGERGGNVPTRAWLDRRYGRGRWGAGSVLNFAIGQGEVLVTPLQLAVLYAAIANNGTACRPYVLDHADSAGRTVHQTAVKTTRLPVSDADLKQVRTGLNRVVEYGTAAAVRLKEVAIAGKTGTAQNPPRPDHAWFVGYAPADDPEVVFSVLVENAGHGASVAAPIAARLIRAWFFPDETQADTTKPWPR